MYNRENQVVQKLCKEVIRNVNKHFGERLKVSSKDHKGDIASFLDTDSDRLISKRLQATFQNDTILSEESSPDARIDKGRVWVIDPLCGSMNVSRGVRFFSTNIALLKEGKPVAAWVIDHARQEVVWSTGNRTVYRDNKKQQSLSKIKGYPQINVDWGYWFKLNKNVRLRYSNFARDVIFRYDWRVHSLNSSLAFAYIATGQQQASITIHINQWDWIASTFLIEQNGGIVTNLDGSPWTLKSKSLLMSSGRKIHNKLLKLLKKNKCTKII